MARPLRSLILLLLSTVTPAFAVAGPAAERRLTFTVFAAEPMGPLVYTPKPGAKPVPLVLYPTAQSPRYFQQGSGTVILRNQATGAVVAEVAVPVAIRRALLILLPDPGPLAPFPCRVWVIDDGSARDTSGMLRLLNLSGLRLAGTINRRPVVISQDQMEQYAAGSVAAVALRTEFKGRSYQAYAEIIPLGIDRRVLLLLLPPYHSGALQVQSRVLREVADAGSKRGE